MERINKYLIIYFMKKKSFQTYSQINYEKNSEPLDCVISLTKTVFLPYILVTLSYDKQLGRTLVLSNELQKLKIGNFYLNFVLCKCKKISFYLNLVTCSRITPSIMIPPLIWENK